MLQAMRNYCDALIAGIGAGWNRFWYTPGDPAPLAATRIGAGLVAIYVHLVYTWDLIRWFGPEGMLPVDLVAQLGGLDGAGQPRRWGFSYLNYLSSETELWIAHGIGLLVLVAFTVGLFTRVTSILALLVTLSYIHRAPLLTGIAEPVLAMLLFYLCLGPCGARFSVDAWRAGRKSADAEVAPSFAATISLRLIQTHLCLIYFMAAISKMSEAGDAWWSGMGVWWLVAKPESRAIDLTGYLYQWPYVVNFWSHSIVLFELAFAIFIWKRLARPLLLVVAVPMWISLGLITGHLTFAMLMLAANLAFVSPMVLRAAARRPVESPGEPLPAGNPTSVEPATTA